MTQQCRRVGTIFFITERFQRGFQRAKWNYLCQKFLLQEVLRTNYTIDEVPVSEVCFARSQFQVNPPSAFLAFRVQRFALTGRYRWVSAATLQVR